MQIFGQIGDGGGDLPMDGMYGAVGRPAQGNDAQIESGALERKNFLRDEGLRKAGVAFQDDGKGRVRACLAGLVLSCRGFQMPAPTRERSCRLNREK